MLLEINHLADVAAYLPESTSAPKKPRSKTALTETFIKGLKASGKMEKFTDGMGLYLVVLPSGGKSFRYDYRLTGSDGISKRETLTVGRYEPGNRSINATVKAINDKLGADAEPFESFSVHDLRRTASTRLNEAMFPEALIEACLAHQKQDQVAAAYNHAKHLGPRRALMQGWADMVDCWLKGESAKYVIAATKVRIDEATHNDADMDL